MTGYYKIKCSLCSKIAHVIDPFHPWLNDHTLCYYHYLKWLEKTQGPNKCA